MTKHLKILYKGQRLTQSQWARRMGLNVTTLHQRLSRGWDIEEAIETPIIKSVGYDINKKFNCVPRTCPPKAHPIMRLIIKEMRRQLVTWFMLAQRSGVGYYTIEGWRRKGLGTFTNVEAVCDVLGIDIIAKINLRKI